MKRFIALIFLTVGIINTNFAQVGVGTTTPDSSSILDIRSTNKGVLFPKVTLQGPNTVAPLTNPAKGLIVWNTGATWGTPGFYYNDSNSVTPSWVKIAAGAVMQNTLTNGKVWIGNATNIGAEQTMSGDFTMTNTGVSDITNDSVSGAKINITGNTNGSLMYYDGTDWVNLAPDTAGKILRTNGAGAPTWVNANTLNVNNIYTTDGALTGARIVTIGANSLTFRSTAVNGFSVNDTTFSIDGVNNRIGIGTTTPSHPVHLKRFGSASIRLENYASGGGSVYLGTPTTTITGGVGSLSNNDFPIFTNNADRIIVKGSSGDVGIGTATPASKLDVVGKTKTTNFQMTSGAANGYVLKSDSFGNGTWNNVTSILNTQNGLRYDTTSPNASTSNPYLELGGPLVRNTTIAMGNNNLSFTNTNGLLRVTTTGTGNVAMGNNLTVTGANSFVSGQNNTVSGANSTVSGLSNNVSGNYNAVSGQNNVVAGSHSNVSGISNNENGIDNVVGGTLNYVTPGFGHSIVVGNSDTIAGSATAVFGFKNKVTAFEAFAQGDRNLASGNASAVFGASNIASGTNAFVTGQNNIGSKSNVLVSGTGNNVSGSYSSVSGQNNIVTGSASNVSGISNNANGTDDVVGGTFNYVTPGFGHSIVVGNSDTVIGSATAVFGFKNKVTAFEAFAQGDRNTASGQASAVFGGLNVASGGEAFVIGDNNIGSGLASFAGGYFSRAPSFAEVSLGTFGTIYTPLSTNTIAFGDRLFNIGNGTSSSSRTDAFTVLKSGSIGINNSLPFNRLDIANTTRSGSHAIGRPLYVTGAMNANNSGIEFRHENGTQGIGFGFNTIYATGSNATQDLGLQSLSTGNLNFTTNAIQRMIILGSNGNIGMGLTNPAYGLELNGTFGYGNGTAGSYRSRTETRDNAGLQASQSGFFETSSPTNYPTGATSWWHLIDVRHSNNLNNYAMQIAGSFFDQDLYYRKTNGNGTQAWSKLLSSTTGWTLNGNTGINDPASPVTYGSSTIGATENYMGTTDANDVVFGTNNIERMRIKQTTGFIGIGMASPNAPLQFANNIANRKIVLWDGSNNDHQYYGLGIGNFTLRYQVDATIANHIFYAGTSTTTSNELMRIQGNGNVGIGGAPATYKLEVINSDASFNGVRVGRGAGNVLGNTVVGFSALNANSTGFVNTAIGKSALNANTTGADNTAIGVNAMFYNTTGTMNSSIGTYSLFNNTTGNYNSGMGKNALYSNTTGSYNTALGYGADVSNVALTNATAIGANAIVSASNSLVLGSGANVGIGTSTPAASLEIGGNPTNAIRTAYLNISGNNTNTTDRPYIRGLADHLVIAPRTTGVSLMYYSYPGDLAVGGTVSTRIQETVFISATGSAGGGNVSIGAAPSTRKLFVSDVSTTNGTGYATASTSSILAQCAASSTTYSFGVVGYQIGSGIRSGGVHGAYSGATWGTMGYMSSASTTYGGYFTTTTTGTGFLPTNEIQGIGIGAHGATIGSWSRASIIGNVNTGEMMSSYNIGNEYTSGHQVDIVNNGNKRMAAYSSTSPDIQVNKAGTGKLSEGRATIQFDENFANLLDKNSIPVVTITPIGNCNGIHIETITSNGFTIAENNGGSSNVAFTYIVIGNRIDASNTNIPQDILDSKFDENMKKVMFDENDKEHSATPIWWDGSKIRFDPLPKSLQNKK